MEFTDVISDNNLTITLHTTQSVYLNLNPPIGVLTTTAIFSYYKCSKAGIYNLVAEIVNIHQDSAINPAFISVDYTLYIFIYTDDTFSTISSQYSVTVSAPNSITDIRTLSLETGLISLTVGQCALVDYTIEIVGAAATLDYPFVSDTINFFQKEDNSVCENFDNELQDSKARMIDFKYPLCFEDFLTIKKNKRGYISVENKKFWIKSLKYNPQKESEFQLIGNNSIIK